MSISIFLLLIFFDKGIFFHFSFIAPIFTLILLFFFNEAFNFPATVSKVIFFLFDSLKNIFATQRVPLPQASASSPLELYIVIFPSTFGNKLFSIVII